MISGEKIAEFLGAVDPDGFIDGLHELELAAVDRAGQDEYGGWRAPPSPSGR